MYSEDRAFLIAKVMLQINEKITTTGVCLGQGLKKFGSRGNDAASKELKQLHDRNCFTPINIDEITPSERKNAIDELLLRTEKKDGTIKAGWSTVDKEHVNGFPKLIQPVLWHMLRV